MFDYLDKVIQEFPKAITGSAASPAPCHLFKVRDKSEAEYLHKEQAIAFHHFASQLLSLTTPARRDIGMAMSYLTFTVERPDTD